MFSVQIQANTLLQGIIYKLQKNLTINFLLSLRLFFPFIYLFFVVKIQEQLGRFIIYLFIYLF